MSTPTLTCTGALAGLLLMACSGGGGTAPRPIAPPPPPPPTPQQVRCTQDFGDPATSLYQLPFLPGRTYTLLQGYCPSNPAWGHFGWIAYDFTMPIGDTIVASRAGTVRFVQEQWPDGDRICGHENSVFIGHADGSVMSYVHLTTDGALVEVGQVVQAGEPIALSGDSGCSSGPHLHVALFRDATNFGSANTIPLNYHDAEGRHDVRHGLMQGERYRVRAP